MAYKEKHNRFRNTDFVRNEEEWGSPVQNDM